MSPNTDSADALRAFAAAVVPGLDVDATPGASDIGADRFIVHYLPEPDLSELDLSTEPLEVGGPPSDPDIAGQLGRKVDASSALREASLLAIASVYSSWSGSDGEGNIVSLPLGWSLAAYDGPARGRGPLGA
jgi:hypothetical protein